MAKATDKVTAAEDRFSIGRNTALLLYGQSPNDGPEPYIKPRAPKQDTAESHVCSILAGLDQEGRIQDNMPLREVRKLIGAKYRSSHPDEKEPARRTMNRSIKKYLAERSVK